ncbi:MAG: START-like domain-containing protein [Cyclobacteriaceae bacterium]|nr:START-like domain-containing protein [Cyclobacteriaceae bacterium]
MGKTLFTGDFEINASNKMLYPYISSASGLTQWFADDVSIDEDGVFNFTWDHENHKAKMVSHRQNHYCKFEFLPETEEDKEDPSHFELRLELNELTQSVYIKITDYSDFEDEEELHDLWSSLIETLKETVGG